MSLGARIKHRRVELALSQARLGELSGTSQQTIDRLERGITDHSRHLLGIAKALGVTQEWLLFGDSSVASSVDDSARLQPVSRPTGPTEGAALNLSEEPVKAGKIDQKPLEIAVTGPRIRLTFDREVSPAVAKQILDLIEGEEPTAAMPLDFTSVEWKR